MTGKPLRSVSFQFVARCVPLGLHQSFSEALLPQAFAATCCLIWRHSIYVHCVTQPGGKWRALHDAVEFDMPVQIHNIIMFNVSVLNFKFFYSAAVSRGRNSQLLQMVHKYLKANVICQDCSPSTPILHTLASNRNTQKCYYK